MSFESEELLRQTVKPPLLKEFQNGKEVEHLEEFNYGAGRTDLVIGRLSKAYFKRRVSELGLNIPLLKSLHLKVFLLLHKRKEITRDYFIKLCQNNGYGKTAIQWLEKNGFIRVTDDNKIRTPFKFRKHVTRSFAVELKTQDWKTALEQAYRAKCYTDYQFVVLDDEFVHRAKQNEGRFEKFNIGIASITEKGQFTIHRFPYREKPFNSHLNWKLNERILSEYSA